jgi:hypothetical protein
MSFFGGDSSFVSFVRINSSQLRCIPGLWDIKVVVCKDARGGIAYNRGAVQFLRCTSYMPGLLQVLD